MVPQLILYLFHTAVGESSMGDHHICLPKPQSFHQLSISFMSCSMPYLDDISIPASRTSASQQSFLVSPMSTTVATPVAKLPTISRNATNPFQHPFKYWDINIHDFLGIISEEPLDLMFGQVDPSLIT